MAVTTYRYDKIIKEVIKSTRYQTHWGYGGVEESIVIVYAVQKYKSRKVKPMMGDDYSVGEWVTEEVREEIKFTQEKFDALTALIGQPRVVRHSEDPLTSS